MKHYWGVLAVLIMACLPTEATKAAVYKCDQGGRIAYQGTPCQPGQLPHQLPPGIAPNPAPEPAQPTPQTPPTQQTAPEPQAAEIDIVEQRARAAERDHKFTDLAKQGKVELGMEPRHVELAWGKPRKISRSLEAEHTREQWTYAKSRKVYIEDGIVTDIQH
jgi:hypothetical protein